MLMQYTVVIFLALIQCLHLTRAFAPRLRLGFQRKSRIRSNNSDDDQEEWRAFRAKLVQNEALMARHQTLSDMRTPPHR